MDGILTLDVGTTSVKVSVFDKGLKLLGFSSQEYHLSTPQPDFVEIQPEIYWDAVAAGARAAVEQAGSCIIRAVCASTQGETLIPVARDGTPIGNAIVWLDARATEEAALVRRRFSPAESYPVTGLPELGPATPLCKILWMKRHEPERYRQTWKFLLLEDYLLFRLTGNAVTEQSLLSSTGYSDINKGTLWQEMLDCMDIPPGKFPGVLDCGAVAGPILQEAADALGISRDAVVVTGAMDQVASAVGAGNTRSGIITETTGTALVIAATTNRPDYTNPARVTVYRHAIPGHFVVLPFCPTAGMLLKWFKDEFMLAEQQLCESSGGDIYQLMDKLAAEVPPLSGGLTVFPHFAGMSTPHILPGAKGVFCGVGLETTRSHFIRAILEAVAYALRENLELLEAMGISSPEVVSLGGGAKSGLWCEIKANVTGREILCRSHGETTSLGAAILAGNALGLLDGNATGPHVHGQGKRFQPEPRQAARYETGYADYRRVSLACGPLWDGQGA